MNEKVSVIVPVYHVEEYLQKCVYSIINQSYSELEIILVDDGGDDECPQMCDDLCKVDSRVKCIHKKNEGQSMARKEGLNCSTGNFIMYVDADDWIEKDTIEICMRTAKLRHADVVCFGYKRIYNKHTFTTEIYSSDCEFEGDDVKALQRRLIGLVGSELSEVEKADRLTPMWGKLYSRDVAMAGIWVSEREIGSLEDALYNLYAFEKCRKFVYIQQFLYCYRKDNSNATTKKYRTNLVDQWDRVFSYFAEYINNYDVGNEFEDALSNRIAFSLLGLGMNELDSERRFLQKSKYLRLILKRDRWKKAYEKLEFNYFPLKWKVFFWSCKYKQTEFLLFMLFVIQRMRSILEK